jgi:hypothetical protein
MKKQDIGVLIGHISLGTPTGSCRRRALVEPYRRASRQKRTLSGRYSRGAFDLQTHPACVKMLG